LHAVPHAQPHRRE